MRADLTPKTLGPLCENGRTNGPNEKRTTDRTKSGPKAIFVKQKQKVMRGPLFGPVWSNWCFGTGPVRSVSVGHYGGPTEPSGQDLNQWKGCRQ